MGGVWTPPLKLVDGVWLGLDAQWVDKAGWRGFSCAGSRTRYCSLPKAAAKAQPGLIQGDRPSATPGNWPLCPNGIPSATATHAVTTHQARLVWIEPCDSRLLPQERAEQLRPATAGSVRRACSLPILRLTYARHFTLHPRARVSGSATASPASTASSARRSHAASWEGSRWSASGAPR